MINLSVQVYKSVYELPRRPFNINKLKNNIYFFVKILCPYNFVYSTK